VRPKALLIIGHSETLKSDVLVWLVATLTFHPDLAFADVTRSVVLLSCTRVTVPPVPTVNVAELPMPGAGLFVVLSGARDAGARGRCRRRCGRDGHPAKHNS
jgi:hypothetical protein